MSRQRLFVAIDLPPDHVRSLSDYSAREGRRWPNSRWAPAGNYHITVCFLGGVEDDSIKGLVAGLADESAAIRPFSLAFRGLTQAPPHRHSTSMIWAVYGGDDFERAAKAVRRAAEKFAPELPEELEHIPHVTLARFRDRAVRPAPPKLNEKLESFTVDSFVLYSSELAPGGSIYAKIADFNLKAR
jgi:2'-5' RNA ligase